MDVTLKIAENRAKEIISLKNAFFNDVIEKEIEYLKQNVCLNNESLMKQAIEMLIKLKIDLNQKICQ
jgi:hypothetical protein